MKDPPADGSPLAYSLLEMVRRQPAYTGDPLPLENTRWVPVAYGSGDRVATIPSEVEIYAHFADDRLSGQNGCNSYSATYAVDGSRLTLSEAVSTRMACGEPAARIEQAFMAALATANSLAIEGNMLTIGYATGQLTFMGEVDGSSKQGKATLPAATIILPDGQECLFAGTGATLSFDGRRLNYSCSDRNKLPLIGLIGEIVQELEGMLQVEQATIGRTEAGFVLEESRLVTFLAVEIDLADDVHCAFAGTGATLAFDGERLNYTCGDPAVGLLGAPKQGDAGVWTVTRVQLVRGTDGFSIAERQELPIPQIRGAEMP